MLLVELLLEEHADLVVCGVQAPVLDVDVVTGQVEVRAHGISLDDLEFVVVSIFKSVGGQPVGDASFALRLHDGTVRGENALVVLHLHVEVATFDE